MSYAVLHIMKASGSCTAIARHVDQHEYYRQCKIKKKDLDKDVATLVTEKEQLDTETRSLEKRKTELERGNRWIEKTIVESKAANAKIVKENSDLEKHKTELEESNSSLAATNTTLSNEKKQLEADKKKVASEIADIEADKSKLIEERSTYAEEAKAAKKEKETALQEAAEAKAQRNANRKDALSNLANRFTGNKTKRLETEVARKDNEIRELKDRAEAREQDFRREMSNLSDSLRRQKESEASTIRIHNYLETDLNTFFPDVLPLLEAARECREAGLSDTVTCALLDQKTRYFKEGATIHSETYRQDFDVSNAEVQIKRNPTDNKFHLHINGTRVFQWLKEQWQRLKQTFSRGIRR